MYVIALKMLFGDRGKYLGLIFGITFASMVITQQSSIFVGIMSRTFGLISDINYPDIWVMDPKVQYIDDLKPLRDTQIQRVRSVDGVAWAMPLYKGLIKARLENGRFQNCNVIGLDDATLVGGPPVMIEGRIENLRMNGGVIVDEAGARGRLARDPTNPGEKPIPLKIGDTLELNDNRAVVVGICQVSRTFQSQPVIFTTYSRATTFAPRERKLMSFILVKAKQGADLQELTARITSATGLAAYSKEQFKKLTAQYYLKFTGIPINFGTAVLLAFLVGTAIVGQVFYNFTQDNLRYFGALKAMGASNWMLVKMIVLQAVIVAHVGYGLGVGAASVFGYLSAKTELAFRLLNEVLIISAGAVVLITVLSAVVSIHRVMKLEPVVVFKS